MLIYMLPVTDIWTKKDEMLLSYVSPKRKDKILKYTHIIDRKLSLYAALLARLGISQLTGISSSELDFTKDLNKKPFLLNDPSLYFSFSHTRNFILCSISKDSDTGADVEKLKTAPLEVMKRVFHPDEIAFVEDAPEELRDIRFFTIWTSKEAFVKFLGTGLTNDLNEINSLSPSHASLLCTWQQEDYICSVYGKDIKNVEKHLYSENQVYKYFVH